MGDLENLPERLKEDIVPKDFGGKISTNEAAVRQVGIY